MKRDLEEWQWQILIFANTNVNGRYAPPPSCHEGSRSTTGFSVQPPCLTVNIIRKNTVLINLKSWKQKHNATPFWTQNWFAEGKHTWPYLIAILIIIIMNNFLRASLKLFLHVIIKNDYMLHNRVVLDNLVRFCLIYTCHVDSTIVSSFK